MTTTYGTKRVLEPQYVLPTSAWKLDNSRDIYPDEMRVSIKRIHLEGTSFKQICTETNNNEEKYAKNHRYNNPQRENAQSGNGYGRACVRHH